LWDHRIFKPRATKVSPFELMYWHECYRFDRQNDLSAFEYHGLMMDNIDEVIDKRIMDLKEIEKDKLIVDKAYNKKVKTKSFQVEDLI
jgi:hypothetical protein